MLLNLLSCSYKKTAEEKWPNGNRKRILEFQNFTDSVFIEKQFNDKGELRRIINHSGSILNGDWISYKDNIKSASGELIKGQYTRGKVTWYDNKGLVNIERYYNDKGNVYQEIDFDKEQHVTDILFFTDKVKRNQFKNWYGWFPNGNLRYIQDTMVFAGSLNEWDISGKKIK
jgi:antitoxin component YwqK of YwqJK toxin-antitoxin module